MEKMNGKSLSIENKNIEKLKELFPNILTDGKIDFEKLKQILGEEVDESREKYQFTWFGKSKSIKLAQTPSSSTLKPNKKKSKNWESTNNLYIEGDNLEVLKQLQKSYFNKIGLIYIDPPYNTGNDFVYEDNFSDSISNYKNITNQQVASNPETSGRYHTKWLNMMYPRLLLARNLLREDGFIAISLDWNENDNLIKICDEVFGENNFIASIPILSNPRGRQSSSFVAETHEYCTIYAKNSNACCVNGDELTQDQKDEYKYKDENGSYRLLGLRLRGGRATAAESPTLHFPIYYDKKNDEFDVKPISKDDYQIIPKFEDGTLGTWRWSKEKILKDKSFLVVKPVKDRYDVFQKDYLTDDKRMKPKSLWAEKEINYDRSKDELKALDMGKYFDYAKPLYLMKKIINMLSKKDSIILDFFSGSSTTAQGVIEQNINDCGQRKFIMVQIPELISESSDAYKDGFKNICDIGEERIRRAINNIEKNKEIDLEKLDLGFKVFELDSTNIKPWDNSSVQEEENLLNFNEVFKEGRTQEDILYEIMLKYGIFDQQVSIEKINDKKLFKVGSRYMIVCLEDKITAVDIEKIGELKPRVVVFKESGFDNDNDKINATHNLEKAGVEEIKCI